MAPRPVRQSVADNDDCNLVSRLWLLLSDPASGEFYLGNIIQNGLHDPSLGIDIPAFATIATGDVPEQTMFSWGGLGYMKLSMSGTALSGLGSFEGGRMSCTATSPYETTLDLSLVFRAVDFTGGYEVASGGAVGCAVATAATILGAGAAGAAASGDEDSNLWLAQWYRDVGLQESDNGQLAVGAYYLHEDTIQEVTTADNPASANYRTVLAQQRATSEAVAASTRYWQQQQSGEDPAGEPPKIGDPMQYTGGFKTYVYLQYAVQQMMAERGLRLVADDNPYAELLNSMTHFNAQVKAFQKDHPGEQITATIMDYVAAAPAVPQERYAELGIEGIPVYDLESGDVVDHVEPWPVDVERLRTAYLARAPRDADAFEFRVDGSFRDAAQQLQLGAVATFTYDDAGLLGRVDGVRISMSNLDIELGNRAGFDSQPGLYEKASTWIANTQSFQDTLKSRLNAALNDPSVLGKLSDVLNAGLAKLGLR